MVSTRRAHFILKQPNHGAALRGEREIVILEFVQKLLSILLILNEKLFTIFTLFTFDWTIHLFFRILEEIGKMHGAGAYLTWWVLLFIKGAFHFAKPTS